MIQAAKNQKQANKGGLAKLPQLRIGAEVMLTIKIDTQDRLIKGQVREFFSY